MHWLGIVCNIFWKSLNVAISMGKLTKGFLGSTYVELSLLNISLLCREFLEFCNMGKLKNALWGSVLNCPYPTFHCFVRNSWNIEIGGCIVGRYAELSLTNMIWEFIKRSLFIIGVDWGMNSFGYIWYIQNLPMPKLKRKLV